MKKRIFEVLVYGAIVIGIVVPAHAGLIDINNNIGHVIYDDVNENYWIWDLSTFTNMTYYEQKAKTDSLEYFGMNNWEMAGRDQMEALFSQISAENTFVYELFGKSGVSIDFQGDSNDQWMGRFDQFTGTVHTFMGGAYVAWNDNMYHGVQLGSIHTNYASLTTGAWVFANVIPVPEPGTMLLLCAGLVGVLGARKIQGF